jgi:hypothetical protein
MAGPFYGQVSCADPPMLLQHGRPAESRQAHSGAVEGPITQASTVVVPDAPFMHAASPFCVIVPSCCGAVMIPQVAASGVTV